MAFLDIGAADANIPPKTANLKPMIRTVLLADRTTGTEVEKTACWNEMETYTIGRKVCGSKAYDQHAAVMILLEHDTLHGGHIASIMQDNPAATHRYVWTQLIAVLGTWLTIERGVVRGLLTQQKVTDDIS